MQKNNYTQIAFYDIIIEVKKWDIFRRKNINEIQKFNETGFGNDVGDCPCSWNMGRNSSG